MSTDDIAGWALGLRPGDLPQAALAEARRCLLDTLGVAAGATCTRLGGIVAAFAHAQMPGAVPLLFSPGTASAVGAALHG
ncbi:MmgE/PrpD family protein, partial [Arhodomonas sp. KWT]